MKLFLISVLSIALIVIGYYSYRTRKEKHKLARTVGRTLFIGWLIVLFNLISLLTTSEAVGMFAESVYFVGTDWLLYYLLKFSIEYTGNNFERHVKRTFLIALLAADSVSVLLNNVFFHLFRLNPVTLFGGESFFELDITPFFFSHYAIIILLVVICLIVLFYGAFMAPVFYRKKYWVIGLITVGIIVLNILTFSSAVDVSVIGYVIEAICIYYCAFVYTPQKLLQKMLLQVTQDMSVAVFVLDTEGKKLYSNNYADILLSKEKSHVNTDGMSLEEWCHNRYLNETENFIEEQAFYQGEEEVILKIQMQRMIDNKQHLQGGYFVIQDRTEEINNLKQEQYLATHDSMTGLYNYDYFCEVSKRYLEKYPALEFLVICTDIKEFKIINDSFGTKTGDLILKNTARMLKEELTGAVAYGRIGTDVFGILMPKKNFKEAFFTKPKNEDFLRGMEKAITFPVVMHTGIYEVTERDLPISVMCDRARMAIHTIKKDYYKRVVYYDDAMRAGILREQELVRDFDQALKEGQIKMVLQPQVSADGKLLGTEALIRWEHPKKGVIPPGEFIPIFEKNGLISDIDRYIWELACRQLRNWKERGREDIYISVNISPRDFQVLNVYQIFTNLVEKYAIAPKNLKLEIPETAIVTDSDRFAELITRLRRNGFVLEMAKDQERRKKILQMVIGLSGQLGMPVITAGVEAAEQVAFLSETGCDMFQGDYFAEPMTIEEFEKTYL